jgi:hypothetical protein
MDRLRGLSRGGRLVLALAVGGALFGIATAVQADIPDGGTIHGCYKTNKGDLRVIDTSAGGSCQSSETPLDWNQTGPQGRRGPSGPSGATGPPGPEGSGHAFVANSGGPVTVHGPTDIVTLSGLPAGTYLVWSPIEVVGDDDTGTNDVCEWVINGSTIMLANGEDFMFDAKDNGFGRADMSGHLTLATDNSSITVRCDTNTGGATAFGDITALEVGSLN